MPTLYAGASPSPARPPAMSTKPAEARTIRPGAIRVAKRPTTTAATGMRVTTSPATAGSSAHPFTSRITSRKRAALSAADPSRSARFGAQRGRVMGAATTPGVSRRQRARIGTSATGACTRKIASHPASWVRMPPIAGPSAAPRMPARTQTCTARLSEPSNTVEEKQSSGDDEGCSDRLHAASRQNEPEDVRKAAGERGGGEDHEPGEAEGVEGVAGRRARREPRRRRAPGCTRSGPRRPR